MASRYFLYHGLPVRPVQGFTKAPAKKEAAKKAPAKKPAAVPEKKPADPNVGDTHEKVQLWKGGPYWATTNIGAEKPEDFGYYFSWGDTVGYKRENKKWVATDGSSSGFSFEDNNTPSLYYCSDIGDKYWDDEDEDYDYNRFLKDQGWITEDFVLAPGHDAAHVQWGGDWRMPTKQELLDLCKKCVWTSKRVNGVKGFVVRGKGAYASASIFLPAAGEGYDSVLLDDGKRGAYWSSVPWAGDNAEAWSLETYASRLDYVQSRSRSFGRSVRPVQGFTK